MAAVIQAIIEESDSTYGYRRVPAALVRQGDGGGPELVRELMRELSPGGVPATSVAPGDHAAR